MKWNFEGAALWEPTSKISTKPFCENFLLTMFHIVIKIQINFSVR
jgi:hypothetical protein